MNDYPFITKQLGEWNTRRKVRDALVWGPRGLMLGLFIAVIVAAISRFRPILTNIEIAYLAAGLGIVGLLAGTAGVWFRRLSQIQQARFADNTFGLRERITSALELRDGIIDAPESIQNHQFDDTVNAMKRVDAKAILPFELNGQDWTFILLAIVLLLAAIILPNRMESILQGQRAVEQLVADQIERIERLEEAINADSTLSEEEQAELTAPLQEARESLEAGVDSKEEALAALSQAESSLRQLEQQNSTEALRSQMAEAGNSLSSQSGAPLGEAMESGNLSETADNLSQLSESVGELSEAEQQELGRELSQAASALSGTDSELAEQLGEAGSALQQGDVESAEAALAEAGESAEALAEGGEVAEVAGAAAGELSEGRQEVTQSGSEQAQAGEPGETGQQQAEPGEAGGEPAAGQEGQQGQQAGQQAGEAGTQGTQAGQGDGGSQTGAGTVGGEQSGSPGGGTEGGGHTDEVFVPPFRDLSGEEGVAVELSANCQASIENCGELINTNPSEIGAEESIVPYEEVFSEYANTAYEALSEDYIPLGMKEYVRDYFSSLEPGTE